MDEKRSEWWWGVVGMVIVPFYGLFWLIAAAIVGAILGSLAVAIFKILFEHFPLTTEAGFRVGRLSPRLGAPYGILIAEVAVFLALLEKLREAAGSSWVFGQVCGAVAGFIAGGALVLIFAATGETAWALIATAVALGVVVSIVHSVLRAKR